MDGEEAKGAEGTSAAVVPLVLWQRLQTSLTLTPPAAAAAVEAPVDSLAKWNADRREALRVKAAEQKAAIEKRRDEAEERLEKFYTDRTNRLAERELTHRQQDEQLRTDRDKAETAVAEAEGDEKWKARFARVSDLVDITKDSTASLSRFRNVLVAVKHEGLPEGDSLLV